MGKRIIGIIILFFVLIVLFPILYDILKSNNLVEFRDKEKYNIYVVYSPNCPHCHYLFEYLDKIGIETINIQISDFANMKAYEELSKYFKGVPFIFAKVNNSFVIVSGFPSKEQDINGYFYGLETERELCKKTNGTEVFLNNNYAFCNLSGIILGNRYAIDWLINICKNYNCEVVE